MKWTHLVTKKFAHRDHRRPSQGSLQSDSDAPLAVATETGIEKLRLTLPNLFRRRCSSSSASASSTTTTNDTIDADKVRELYSLAVDEVGYAEDSKGSSYYAGDIVAAREAINDYANAFMQYMHQSSLDDRVHDHLQADLSRKLTELRARFDALTPVFDTDYEVVF